MAEPPEQSITLPFKVPDLFGGFAEGKGVANARPSELTLELVVKESVLGVFKSRVKEIRIPKSEVALIRFKRGWFGGRVFVRVKSMKCLADLPGCDSGQITLHVARQDRDRAADFVRILGF